MDTTISSERDLEQQFIEKLCSLKSEYRPDIRDRAALEKNFRGKFEALKTHKKGLMQRLFPAPEEVEA
jgi:hypothetical protein